ncbi:NAD(P)/FAD-dependent oxidoreductase [Aquisphaera insulae]|uniref:NAD(P)/FAD-dependent oxidoreductase n=1 Tax=Aquisphaera insulae TaxID=2712864 RepID=UPI0013E9CC60|nr:NAD(P)/FAD-dependent oxidoreductase [Aquisphaera insulae]
MSVPTPNPAPTLDLDEAAGRTWDAIVLGAGPAGSIAARQLAGRGVRTLLVDRRTFPRPKVCGACLNDASLRELESIGLGDIVRGLGGGRIEALEVGHEGRTLRLRLPGGTAISRPALDAALAGSAVAVGAGFLDGAEGIIGPAAAGARRVTLVAGSRRVQAEARVVLVATGLGPPRFEEDEGVRSVASPGSRVGAGCGLASCPEFGRRDTIFMAVASRGYVGLVRVEGGGLNIAAAFDVGLIRDEGGPGAAARVVLREAGFPIPSGLDGADWRGTPALTRRTRPIAGERYFVLGDAAGYVEPFTGEGMAWAIRSGIDVAPLAEMATAGWSPALSTSWCGLHRARVLRRQRLCRGVAALLKRPWMARLAFAVANHVPAVAGLAIRQAEGGSVPLMDKRVFP